MKRIVLFFLALTLTVAASAQHYDITKLVEIADVESNDQSILSVFSIPDENGQVTCFLCVGTMGLGDEIIQIDVDPINKLFIPLGSTRTEVMETLEGLKQHFEEPAGTSAEVTGCFAPAIPNENRETVTVTSRKVLFSKNLEFKIERDGVIRATYVSRSDFKTLMVNVKLNQRWLPE
ncbi:MAG: hypothetical protein IJG35_10895 [Bacteroidales bacterium]|nr:hypothetical protein [Bacteroidales bacterium]